MPNPNKAVSTELDAVNQILSAVGQAPVTTLDLQNPEVYYPTDSTRCKQGVQSGSWYFNTENSVEFTPNSSNEIPLLTMFCRLMQHVLSMEITLLSL